MVTWMLRQNLNAMSCDYLSFFDMLQTVSKHFIGNVGATMALSAFKTVSIILFDAFCSNMINMSALGVYYWNI